MNKIMIATFIGKDGSMGLNHDQSYVMEFEEYGFFRRLFSVYKSAVIITVRRGPFDFVTIPYSRREGFLKNWHVTKV